jgi:urea transport system permease protein
MSPANSIEMVIWVAVGGRGTIVGPVLGAFLVNGAKSVFTVWLPEYWLYVLGLLFVLVTLFMPEGVVGLAKRLRGRGRTEPKVVTQPKPVPAAPKAERKAAVSAERGVEKPA